MPNGHHHLFKVVIIVPVVVIVVAIVRQKPASARLTLPALRKCTVSCTAQCKQDKAPSSQACLQTPRGCSLHLLMLTNVGWSVSGRHLLLLWGVLRPHVPPWREGVGGPGRRQKLFAAVCSGSMMRGLTKQFSITHNYLSSHA